MTEKLIIGNRLIPVDIKEDKKKLYFKFRFNRSLIEEIKALDGARWHPDEKIWSAHKSEHNLFQLNYLRGENPYAKYDSPLIDYESKRPLFQHQIEMVKHGLTRKTCIFACEMGTGKTLGAIEIMENSNIENWYWIGPKSALEAVKLEFKKWDAKIWPNFYTYEKLKKLLENWPYGEKSPAGLILDESSRIKNPNAQRSQAVKYLTMNMRLEHENYYIIAMSGTPAPKAPVDWWHQCEVVCPGFLKEGNIHKFRNRLAIIQSRESITGGMYPHLVTWLDDEKKCKICGEYENHSNHMVEHGFEASKNEVKFLYRRMAGLVLVKFKKDCLNLPEKHYRVIRCAPSTDTVRALNIIVSQSPRAITALTLSRELSDGFQYEKTEIGKIICNECEGTGKIEDEICPTCFGEGKSPKYKQSVKEVKCPKIQVLKDLLDEHDEIGRIVIYAGFTGSVDKCVKICHKMGWATIKVDGRGWEGKNFDGTALDKNRLLEIFQDGQEEWPRVAFVGQPSAAGMGLTLTASPTIVYYSNDFNAESRIQSEDRIHRPGMTGATIIDIIHLETDELVLNNLKQKRKLQDMSMGILKEALSVD